MKVLLFIYCQGKASGGHYHSLDQLSREIRKDVSLKIVSLGPVTSPVLLGNPCFKKHILFNNKKDLFVLNNSVKELVLEESATLFHCFDTESMNWLLLTSIARKFPFVLSKCGGPNPTRKNWQYADQIILFSKENYDWFNFNPGYSGKRLHLIPNRVNKLVFLDEIKRSEIKNNSVINFVRISRLGGAYEKTLRDTLTMIDSLRLEYPVHLYIIGRVQNEIRFADFEKDIADRKLPVTIITDARASRGADFLYLADFVIGTGRSFMEALSLGIPSLTPSINMDWPVLVRKENFELLFSTNFSERNMADLASVTNNREHIVTLIKDKKAYLEAQKEALQLFNDNFNLEGVGKKYLSVYKQALVSGHNRFKLIIKNFPYLLKTIFS